MYSHHQKKSYICFSILPQNKYLWGFPVKDLNTEAPLVCEQNGDGLYHGPSSSPTNPQCNMAIPLHLWHHRLRHPNFRILNKILHQFSVPIQKLFPLVILIASIRWIGCFSLKVPYIVNNHYKQFTMIYGALPSVVSW